MKFDEFYIKETVVPEVQHSELTFYHYGSGEKGLGGLWGSTDENLWKGNYPIKKTFRFGKNDKVLVMKGTQREMGTDELFTKWNLKNKYKDENNEWLYNIENGGFYSEWISMIVAKELIEKGYDGFIYNPPNEDQWIGLDLREFTVDEIDKNIEKIKKGEIEI
jgi:hypothetical protein